MRQRRGSRKQLCVFLSFRFPFQSPGNNRFPCFSGFPFNQGDKGTFDKTHTPSRLCETCAHSWSCKALKSNWTCIILGARFRLKRSIRIGQRGLDIIHSSSPCSFPLGKGFLVLPSLAIQQEPRKPKQPARAWQTLGVFIVEALLIDLAF